MKKTIATGMAVVLLCISQTGCSGETAVNEAVDQTASAAQAENENAPAVNEGDDAQDGEAVQEQDLEESGFSFADLSEYSFNFSSGAGAWGTGLEINADGSFAGSYHDSNMGDTGEGYPNGSVAICNFNGQFTQLEKVNEYTYSMKMEELKYEKASGIEEIIDGVKFIYSGAYGLEGGNEFLVYLPGAPVSELPEEFVMWVNYSISGDSKLQFCGLYNVDEQYGFSGYSEENFGGEQYDSQNNNTQYNNADTYTYDDSYMQYAGAYTQKYAGDFYQSDESGRCWISMYSSREGSEIGNIEIECEWLGSYKGTVYDYGTPNEYNVISTSSGPDLYLEFNYDGSTPYLKLKQEPPKTADAEWMIIGIFYMTEHYES